MQQSATGVSASRHPEISPLTAAASRRTADPLSPFAGRHVLMVVAHFDDETLGAGAQFTTFGRLSLIHVTDGAPTSRYARSKGFASRTAYRDARRRELLAALASAGVVADRHELGYRDIEASFHIAPLARRLARLVRRLRPDIVLTHTFEGGNVDHDATAAAVHAAMRRLPQPPPLWEFSGYHPRPDGGTEHGVFLPPERPGTVHLELNDEAQAGKRQMLAKFATQRDIVVQFPLAEESFRPAPAYDFAAPRSPEMLAYDLHHWRIDGDMWRTLWAAADCRLNSRAIAGLNNVWLAFNIRWALWVRRVRHDRPRLARLMSRMAGMTRLPRPR